MTVLGAGATLRTVVLLVEDDPGDALLVEELLVDASPGFEVARAATLAAAATMLTAAVDCVLLDLGLPDAHGLEAVEAIVARNADVAVVVLTGQDDHGTGLGAVAAGAQDYVSKTRMDEGSLIRSIRYAVERKRAEGLSRQLLANELVTGESLRLERGLLPRPHLLPAGLSWALRYRPSGGALTLGGDFYDIVGLEDGRIRAVIGDVRGHGPDEAAVGVALRIAWRSLVLAGVDESAVLGHLQRLLVAERTSDEMFATVCDVTIAADRRSLGVRSAGHPAPLLLGQRVRAVPSPAGPPIGVLDDVGWEPSTSTLGPGWRLVLYTDGLVEGRVGGPGVVERWSVDGLVAALALAGTAGTGLGELADHVIALAESQHGGPLPDDVAVLMLEDTTP